MPEQPRSYLEINAEALAELKADAEKSGYWAKYNSVKRFLECQDEYVKAFRKAEAEGRKTAAAESGGQAAMNHWNNWANERLIRRQKLMEAGDWEDYYDLSEEARRWYIDSDVNFHRIAFVEDLINLNKVKKINKLNKKYDNIIICRSISFSEYVFPCNITLSNASFYSNVYFERSKFYGKANFHNSEFFKSAIFSISKFYKEANFESVKFMGIVDFVYVKFYGSIYFSFSEFRNIVKFGLKIKSSNNTIFHNRAYFILCKFNSIATFDNVKFFGKVDFSVIQSKKGFSLHGARFAHVPDFNEATFHAPPVLDDVRIDDQLRPRRDGWFRAVPNPRENAREKSRNFRALGKMAHEARDWHNEMEFFAQEIRCRRFGETFPRGRNMGRFWFGVFYEKFSNFGRSFARPVGHWLALTLFFFPLLYLLLASGGAWQILGWLLYLAISMGIIYHWYAKTPRPFFRRGMRFFLKRMHKPTARIFSSFMRPVMVAGSLLVSLGIYSLLWPSDFMKTVFCNGGDALMLSLRQGLVFSGLTRNGHLMESLKNLYGLPIPHAPAFWMMAQTLLSAICFFFLFLALRNHFRIR